MSLKMVANSMVVDSLHIRAVGVEKSYELGQNTVHALRGVNLEVKRGEILALCGTSGSGKSTLLNLLGCLDQPTTGQIVFAGRAVNTLSDADLAKFRASQLGFVFQTFNLLPVLSAVENVEYPLLKNKVPTDTRRAQALEALKLVGLENHSHHRPDQLSGGQRQRVAIARAVVHRPEIIIADEPTANLDKRTAGEILDLLVDMNKRLGVTIIIATHDPLVMSRVRRVIDISDGMIKSTQMSEAVSSRG